MTVFNWDVVQHETVGEPWRFDADGKTWRVPHISDLTVGQQLSADAGHLAAVLGDVCEVLDSKTGEWSKAGNAAKKLVLGKHSDQVGAFTAAWLAHAGLKPGESQASSPS